MTYQPTSPLRILFADDDEAFRETTADLLRGDGYLVDTAEDGLSAVDLLRGNTYDLLLSDILMPGNRDLDLVRCIHEEDPNLPVILVTGYPSVTTAVEALQLAVKAYLTKPLDYGGLLAELKRVEERVQTRRLLLTSQDRLTGWMGDLERVQRVIRDASPGVNKDVAREVLALSLSNIANVLLDMRALFDLTLAAESPSTDICAIQQCPRLQALEQGLRHAVEVLEETKHAFKSKSLGNLRVELEGLIDKAATPQA